MIQRLTSGLLGVLLMGVAATAQTLTVTPGPLSKGQSIQIKYEDPANAGGTITVLIDDGALPAPGVVEVVIQLDSDGKGSATWVVPDWVSASFNAPKVKEQVRAIQ